MNKHRVVTLFLLLMVVLSGCSKEINNINTSNTQSTVESSNTTSFDIDLPQLSSRGDFLDLDFDVLKMRLGYSLNGPSDGWKNVVAAQLAISNLDLVDCYLNTSSEPKELYGFKNGKIVFGGVYGISSYAYVKDFLSDEELKIKPAVFSSNKGDDFAEYIWKIENGYKILTVINVATFEWYNQMVYSMVQVNDVSYISCFSDTSKDKIEKYEEYIQTEPLTTFNISKSLSNLNLTPLEVSVSDSTDIGLSEKMMKDYISYRGKGETYYSLGRCNGVEGGFIQNGYAFVTADQINKDNIEYFYYAIPDNSALYLCYVDSKVHICWKNNLPSNVDKATQLVKSVMGEAIPLENIQSNGFYTFWHNDRMLYVNWECNQIFVSTDDGGKTQIYPTDTIGYFQ